MADIASAPVAMLRLSPFKVDSYGFRVAGSMVSFTTFGPLAIIRAGIGCEASPTHAEGASPTGPTSIIDADGSVVCTANVGFPRRPPQDGTAIVSTGANSNATATNSSYGLTYGCPTGALDDTRFLVNVCHLAIIMDGRPTPSASDRDGFADLRWV